ncbi:MAG TPA: SOS response-associated peptidase family protein, partial [Myxococcales bacterium]
MAAEGEIARVHHRMPVIVPGDAAAAWLRDARLLPLPGTQLVSRAVSPKVNNVRNDGPDLLQPPGQLALF